MKKSLFAVAALSLATVGVACSDSTSQGSGTMVVHLTDAPFSTDSVKSVDVYVVRVDGRQAAADSASAAEGATDDSAAAGGWTTLAKPNAMYNLLTLQQGVDTTLGANVIPAGSWSGFRLIIDPSKSSLTLKNGQVLSGSTNPGVSFPSGSRTGIKIVLSAPIVVKADDTTHVEVAFDVGNSFVMRGNSISQNGLTFKPVIRATVK
ncbi:MAG TPA: DUF4382 domain-containing protein [Gemmatimonadaceae bacterium]